MVKIIKTSLSFTLLLIAILAMLGFFGYVGIQSLLREFSTNTETPKKAAQSAMGKGVLVASGCSMAGAADIFTGDAHELFNLDHVPIFDIYLPSEKWTLLLKNAVDEQYTDAEVCFDGYRIGNVGVRVKGSYGTLYGCFDTEGNMTCPRLSLKLNFKKYDKSVQFFNLKRLNFNANRFDGSHMREKLAYDIYRSMGIVAPRAFWAVIRVNGNSYGLYSMVEQIDANFIDDRWPNNSNGNLFKEVWPTEIHSKAIVNALKTNKAKPDIRDFQAFSTEVVNAKDDESVLTAVEKYSDIEYWARYLAVDEAILSYDGVTYFFTEDGKQGRNHNYYFYQVDAERFTLVPWDVESSFWINPHHAPPHWTITPEDCSTTYPYWEGLAVAPGCDPILKALGSEPEKWHAAISALLSGPFAHKTMLETIDRYEAIIGDYARAKETPQAYVSFDEAMSYLRSVIPELRARMEAFVEK